MTSSVSSEDSDCEQFNRFKKWVKLNCILLLIDMTLTFFAHADQAIIWEPVLFGGFLFALAGWVFKCKKPDNQTIDLVCELVIASIHISHMGNLVYQSLNADTFLLFHHILLLFGDSFSFKHFAHLIFEILSDTFDICAFFYTLKRLYKLIKERCCGTDHEDQCVHPNNPIILRKSEIEARLRRSSIPEDEYLI